MKKKVIIDCDVGVDDALALILAFGSPELEVLGVTGVNGNVSLPKVMKNIEKVLTLIRPSNRPWVARGADRPLQGDPAHAESLHGEDGLGGVRIQPEEAGRYWQAFPGAAEELLIEMARRYPAQITLIAIGPLTNLALALQKDPEAMRQFDDIVVMGGAVRTRGNITPQAEFNFYVDPLAAKIVLDSGLPVTLVPLDATRQVSLTPQLMEERVRPIGNPLARFVIEATGYDAAKGHFRGGRSAFFLHDPLAAGSVIDPRLLKKEELYISVETKGGEFCGRSFEIPSGGRRVEVCFGVDRDNFLEIFLNRLKG
jgi:inosine-uridine nucleoside N-ribohydrolase